MAKAERRAKEEGKLLADNAQPMIADELTAVAIKDGVSPKARNMILPIATMVLMMPIMLAYTGWEAALANRASEGFFGLMLMAFAIGAVCKELGTGLYVAEVAKTWLSPALVPFIVFVVSCFIAFSTGTSWGTFAIMIAIAVPMAQEMDANVHLAIAAAFGIFRIVF